MGRQRGVVILTALAGCRVGVNASRQAGGALAVAVFGALLASGGGSQQGLRVSLLIAAAVGLAAAGGAAALKARRRVTA